MFPGRAVVRALVALVLGTAPAAGQGPTVPADSLLVRPVTIALRNVTLAEALLRLRHEHDVPLAYSGDLLPVRHRVSVAGTAMPLGQLLTQVLAGSGLEVVATRGGTLVVVRRPDPAGDAGAANPQSAIAAALMATGVRQLDEMIVMGTAVAGAPEREQPTAVAVVPAAELASAAHTRIGDLVRTLLPGVVLWDAGPSGGPPQITSVRGVSSFTSRGLKSYVDGIELASPEFFPLVDGRMIERIEVIRGPQGAALYGPDALNGILQLETRLGQPGPRRVVTRVSATAGPHEPGDASPAALWQDHAASVSAHSPLAGFEVGGSLSRTGSEGELPWQQVLTGQVGWTAQVGGFRVRGSARAGQFKYGQRRFATTGPTSLLHQLDEQAAGVSVLHAILPAWQQSLTIGYHHVAGPREANRSFLLDLRLPLGATHESASRSAIRYATTVDLGQAPFGATFSGGVEHGRRQLERAVRSSPTGRNLIVLFDDALRSTGAHAQARLRLGPSLVATGGTRAEWSPSVGATRGAVWASTAGVSWSRPVGPSTLRLRGAWGRGLRLPEPGMSRAMAIATVRQEANDSLSPERQSGVEAGADLYLAQGSWFKATWFDQRADNLIQQVRVRVDGAVRSFQFQNVGAISNRGAELEAGARLGALTVVGLLYLTESTVLQIAPRYTGELREGDPLPDVPTSVGSLAVRYARGKVTAEVGSTWLGAWTGYDRAAALAVERGELPARNSPRDFWIEYPGVVRPWLAVSADLGGGVSAFLRADNPAQTVRYIRDNLAPPLGRTTVVGVTIQR